MSFAEAATIPVAFLTAVYSLHQLGSIKAGQKVLIHAAAGGVGLAAVQLAQQAGAEIFATASPGKHDYLRSLGIKHVFHSRTLAFADEILRVTDGRGVDLVLNSLTSGDYIPKSLSMLCPGGRFLEMSKRGIWTPAQVAQLRPDVAYEIVAMERTLVEEPAVIGGMLRDVVALMNAGELRPLRLTVFALTEAPAAFRYMQQARHIGKIVLRMPQPLDAALRPDATYLITGGLGGLGLLTAERLAERGARHVVLMGAAPPTRKPSRVSLGSKRPGRAVVTMQADVSVADDVARVLEEILEPCRRCAGSCIPPAS